MAKSGVVKNKSVEDMEVVRLAAQVLFSKKVEDAVLLDLRGLSTITDFYLICTCQNESQMRAIINGTTRALSRKGIKSLRAEYHGGVRWAIIDYGDLIIHLFEKDTRTYYSLERLWADAKVTKLDPADYASPEEEQEDEHEEL